jgi:uncharacterized protein YndB with AHSA1/START domain
MNDSAYAIRTAKDTVRIERTLPGPIERVWAYLTESDKRKQWLASGDMTLRVGEPVDLLFRHDELSEAPGDPPPRHASMKDGHHNIGRITACEPPHLLAYTWGENHGDPSEVRFELAERGRDVLLTVTHMRLDGRDTMRSVAGGWHTHLDILVDRMQGRAPANFWSTYEHIAAEYGRRFASS